MEPVFMVLGQSVATAAVLAMDQGVAVQQLDYARLRGRLLADKQILDCPPSIKAKKKSAASVPKGRPTGRKPTTTGLTIDPPAFGSKVATGEFATSLNAAELLRNGGFEKPITDDLSQAFQLGQQNIPGWEFSGGSVRLVNHTRLLAGEGFQSLLLPCGASASAAICQVFTLDADGPVLISFKLAISKAVEGEIGIVLDGHTIKTIHLSEFWKPDEIALTDQMKWRFVAIPQVKMTSGEHTLGFRVLKFQPRNDRQGDTRDNIQGVLVDAVSAQCGPLNKPIARENRRGWPEEKQVTYEASAPVPLDGLAGTWVSTRTLACYPSLANFYGALRSTKELGGLQYLHFIGVGVAEPVLNTIALDGQPVFCDESRWYPYQLRTRAQCGPLDMESTTRMVFADHGVLNQLVLTNQSDRPVVRTLEMNLQCGQAVDCPNPLTVVLSGSLPRVYCFTPAPDEVITTNAATLARWKISLPPRAGQKIAVAMVMEKTPEQAVQKAQQWGGDFAAAFAAAKAGWEERWQAVFSPGNATYSGCLPVLETDDQALRKLYYLSVVSWLCCERDNFGALPRGFASASPEWSRSQIYFWDVSLVAQNYALLDPGAMKKELRLWLSVDHTKGNHLNMPAGTIARHWYGVNAYAYFLTLDHYLTVTRDFAFLSEQINGKTVFEHFGALAIEWKRRVPAEGKMEDYGSNCWALLEAPPDYKHTVASLNAANVWMMRRLADYRQFLGHPVQAAQLRQEAEALLSSVLGLYDPNTGSWSVLYPDGRRIDSRHCYDFLTVGTTIAGDLPPATKAGMMAFLDRELMTDTWMRAMSWQDPSALDSDRSDHGPAGSYTGWPAVTTQAVAEFGRFDKARDMFHRFSRAFNCAIPQAIELTRVEGLEGLQPRVSTRAGASFSTCSGTFAQVIITTFFGFRPTPDGKAALWEPAAPRGFDGQLRHVHWKGDLYTIVSDNHGLHMEKE